MPRAPLTRQAQIGLALSCLVLLVVSYHRLRMPAGDDGPLRIEGETMGTTYSVLVARPFTPALDTARSAVEAALKRVNGLMSTYDADSELSRFNRHGSEPFPAAPETIAVFSMARRVSELSAGAFDVTVAPLVALWGFGAGAADEETPPEPHELRSAMQLVGWSQIAIDDQRRELTKPSGVKCDLSAIAKGFAVDEVARALDALGARAYLVEIGGELKAKGEKAPDLRWRAGVERPDPHARNVHSTVLLRDVALATSGDYRNYYERDGQRISHTIDPRTGTPVKHRLASVSVMHADAAMADAWATALNVAGPDQGRKLAVDNDLRAYFIVRSGSGGFDTFTTGGFPVERVAPSAATE